MIHGNGPTNNPETNELFAELRRDTLENFTLPNDSLYPECVDGRTKKCKSENNRVTSLAVAIRKAKRAGIVKEKSEFEVEKDERARRVAMMAVKLESEGEVDLTLEVDENRLYRKQLEFCAAGVRSGLMTFDSEE